MSAVLAPLLLLLTAATGEPPAPPPSPAPVVAPAPAPVANGAVAVPQTEVAAAPPIMGGFSRVDPRAPDLVPVVKVAVMHLTPARHARARVLAAERQVVAGLNYRLLLKLRDGSRWRVTVWQKLDHSLQVTEAVRAEQL